MATEEGNRAAARARQTERFARQHEEIVALSKTLLRELDTRRLAVDPNAARRALATFAGRLRVHAAMEEEALYPRLLASSDDRVVAKARELLDELGPIYQGFFAFLARWREAATIQADPESFCRETMQELHRLKVRLERENAELYPLVDALDPTASGERPINPRREL
jgi:hypothetical protein